MPEAQRPLAASLMDQALNQTAGEAAAAGPGGQQLRPLRQITVLARLPRLADIGIAIADELLLSACQITGVPHRQRTAEIYLHCTDENDVSLFLGFSNTLLRHNRRSVFGSAKSGDYVGKSVGGCLDPNRWPAELACR